MTFFNSIRLALFSSQFLWLNASLSVENTIAVTAIGSRFAFKHVRIIRVALLTKAGSVAIVLANTGVILATEEHARTHVVLVARLALITQTGQLAAPSR